jgi:hypothetical protein
MKTVHFVALALVLACASSGSGGSERRDVATGAPQSGDRNIITESEIMAVPSANLYDLIEKLRPNMLRSRGAMTLGGSATTEFAEVYVDGRRYGDIASLRSIVSSQVSRVRYYGSSDAAAKFGMINANGVIEVTIRQ